MAPSKPLLFVILKVLCLQIIGTNDWRKCLPVCTNSPTSSTGEGWHSQVADDDQRTQLTLVGRKCPEGREH